MKYIMDNIFTLNKYDDDDDEKHINIDDLYEKKRTTGASKTI